MTYCDDFNIVDIADLWTGDRDVTIYKDGTGKTWSCNTSYLDALPLE